MRADFKAVLDACVLANFGVCDLFLRLAEGPRLFVPVWTKKILDESQRTQQNYLTPKWPKLQSDNWRNALESTFPEAMVNGYEKLEPSLTNDEKDKHVLAAAIKSQAEIIVTFNVRHFPHEALDSWGIKAVGPADYLITLYCIDSGIVVSKIEAIARKRNKTPEEVLAHLHKSVPAFSEHVAQSLCWVLPI